jgi:hypothetical protein
MRCMLENISEFYLIFSRRLPPYDRTIVLEVFFRNAEL